MSNSLSPTSAADTARPPGLPQQLLQFLPGTGLCCVIAMAATLVSTLHGGPQFLYALFFGVAFHYLSQDPKTRPGIEFCSRTVLRVGVGLLGARITASQIAGLGWTTAGIVIAAVVTTLLCGVLLGRFLGLNRAQSVLSGGAVAICGASAALAISAVLPRTKDSERFTLMVVVTVTVLSTLAMVIYPLAARLLHLPPELAGLFLGGTIHDVAQVVGAGYMLSPETGDYATIVKLTRATLIVPVCLVLAAWQAWKLREGGGFRIAQAFPWFILGFLLASALRSAGLVPDALLPLLHAAAEFMIVAAMTAIGLSANLRRMAGTGPRPLLLGLGTWAAVAIASLVVQALSGRL